MSKQPKKLDSSDHQTVTRPQYKILPHKQHFITFQSDYDYGNYFEVIPCLVKNPKWCHLELKLGHTGCYKKYNQLRRAKSLRLRSLHLESYSLDSQGCGDRINGYFGELDTLARAGHTLKNLSLSVTLDDDLVKRFNKQDVYQRLEKFVKKQKHLDEFAFYNGTRKNPECMTNWLKYLEKNMKVLTIENLSVDDLFRRYTFPKLEVLRFEYILFYGSERSFDLSVVMKCFEHIFSLRSLKALKFVQYHRYDTNAYYEVDCGEDEGEEGNVEEVGDDNEEAEEEEEDENEMEIENENVGDEKEDQNQDANEKNQNQDEKESDKDWEMDSAWGIEKEQENEINDADEDENENENDMGNGQGDQGVETQEPEIEAVGPNVWKVSGADGLAKLFEALQQSFKAEEEGRQKTRHVRQKKYNMTKLQEFPVKFWEVLRESLDKNKKKQLKVKYHKQDENNVKRKKEVFERIFKGLPDGQSFEYEVRQITPFRTDYGWRSKTKTLKSFMFM